MKLCWLISTAGGGGGASVALSCCRQAAAAGHEPTLLVMGPTDDWLEEYAHDFPVESLNLETDERREMPQHLLDWLDTHPQDVLFHNDVREAHPAIPYLPEDLRFVYVVHDTAKMYWKKAVEHESHIDAIVAVSNVVADEFQSELGDPAKLSVVHNGTLFPEGATLNHERDNDLVFLGGGKHLKGAYDVLSLWEALVEKGFGRRLHWFGSVDKTLTERIRRLPESDRIKLHGHAPRSEVFGVASQSKVNLVLSRSESFGMVTIECMGMGCLPVAWDIETGTREIVTHGETGFFAPLGDEEALADQVFTACDRHENLYKGTIEHTRRHFSEKAMWERYETVIEDVMNRAPVARPRPGESPPAYEPPTRYFQLFPESVRSRIRALVGRFPRLGYWVRNLRGY